MTVTIFGATGMVGKQLIIHSLAKGWNVRAFGREIDSLIDKDLQTEKFTAVKGYVFDAGDVQKALKGSDAVLSAIGGAVDGSDQTRSLGIKNIVAQMEKYGPRRIVAVGSVGVLDSEDGNGPGFEQEGYPQEYVPVGREHFAAYMHLKKSKLDWTFMCPPDILDKEADGKLETIPEGSANSWEINAGNLALSMVQAVDSEKFSHQRVGISNL
jgi:putative NADH-flavin reductase